MSQESYITKSFIIHFARQRDQNREDEVGRPCGTYRLEEIRTSCWGSLKSCDHPVFHLKRAEILGVHHYILF